MHAIHLYFQLTFWRRNETQTLLVYVALEIANLGLERLNLQLNESIWLKPIAAQSLGLDFRLQYLLVSPI